jgi:tripartite-type tricarboxylate transporter receptor subunit TctC
VVKIVVGASAGGVTDVVARSYAQYLTQATGAPAIVENVTGAGGNVAFASVARAEPDGYTLGLAAAGNIVINPHIYRNMRFDPVADLVPVAPLAAAPQVVVVGAAVPAKTLPELLELAKAEPGRLNYGSAGLGTTNHLAGALLAKLGGLDLQHVPYRGISPAVTDLVGGNIQLMSVAVAPVIGFVREGKLRPLAAATRERLPDLPDVPTAAEAGLPGYEVTTWFGLVAPRGTPEEVVDRLNGLARAMVADPAERRRLEASHLVPMSMSPAEFAALVKADSASWARTAAGLGVSLE